MTGPINKAINMAGYHYAGHTEILAEFTGSRDYAMMLVDGGLQLAPQPTCHCARPVTVEVGC